MEKKATDPVSGKRAPCCWHLFLQPWGLLVAGVQVTVIPRICCQHGENGASYQDLAPEGDGHGDYVQYNPPAAVQPAPLPGLIIPGRPGHG